MYLALSNEIEKCGGDGASVIIGHKKVVPRLKRDIRYPFIVTNIELNLQYSPSLKKIHLL